MIKLMISHETRQLFRSGALWSILGLVVLAIVFAAWSGGRSVTRQLAGAGAAAKFEDGLRNHMRRDAEKYEAKVTSEGGEYQFAAVRHAPGMGPPQGTNAGAVGAETAMYVSLPPTGLAALSIGQSDIQLNYLPVSMATTLDVTKYLELENPVSLMTGSLDIAFVVIFLLPIFILAMSYDLLSSEKERGTLAMILAHPISLRELLASKIIARAGMLLAVVLALGLIALFSIGTDLGSADTWARFGLWVVATLLYALFWFSLAVLVNVYGNNSATNGTVLAGIWLVVVVVVPTLVSLVATAVHPAPSRMKTYAAPHVFPSPGGQSSRMAPATIVSPSTATNSPKKSTGAPSAAVSSVVSFRIGIWACATPLLKRRQIALEQRAWTHPKRTPREPGARVVMRASLLDVSDEISLDKALPPLTNL